MGINIDLLVENERERMSFQNMVSVEQGGYMTQKGRFVINAVVLRKGKDRDTSCLMQGRCADSVRQEVVIERT